MGGLRGVVESTLLKSLETIVRPAELYDPAGNYILFDILGGPVWVHALFAIIAGDLDPAGATGATAEFTINGIAVDAGGVAVAGGAAGDLLLSPLDDTATGVVVVNLAAVSLPSAAALVAGGGKILATDVPGEITLIVGVGEFVDVCTFYCVYQRITPGSQIVVH